MKLYYLVSNIDDDGELINIYIVDSLEKAKEDFWVYADRNSDVLMCALSKINKDTILESPNIYLLLIVTKEDRMSLVTLDGHTFKLNPKKDLNDILLIQDEMQHAYPQLTYEIFACYPIKRINVEK